MHERLYVGRRPSGPGGSGVVAVRWTHGNEGGQLLRPRDDLWSGFRDDPSWEPRFAWGFRYHYGVTRLALALCADAIGAGRPDAADDARALKVFRDVADLMLAGLQADAIRITSADVLKCVDIAEHGQRHEARDYDQRLNGGYTREQVKEMLRQARARRAARTKYRPDEDGTFGFEADDD